MTEQQARTYLDWAATTPLCSQAADAMCKLLIPWPDSPAASFNANSLHSEGREAFTCMEQSRASIARAIGARPDEIIFTASATESDYLGIRGMVRGLRDARRRTSGNKDFAGKVITSTIEHDAVLSACAMLERDGFEVVYVKPNKQGFVTPSEIEPYLDESCVVVSIMAVNNEIGSVMPIADLATQAHSVGAMFHTDAVQMLGKIALNVRDSGVDAASFSAHKICGPKGIGALFLRSQTAFVPEMVGGGQERGMRGGTQNVAAMAGFAAAVQQYCSSIADLEAEAARQRALRDYLYASLCSYEHVVPSVPCVEGSRDYAPHIVNVCVEGIETETLILQLDRAGFAVSGGSACSSHSLEPSRVLLEIGINKDLALCCLRVSLGVFTTEDDCAQFVQAFDSIVQA